MLVGRFGLAASPVCLYRLGITVSALRIRLYGFLVCERIALLVGARNCFPRTLLAGRHEVRVHAERQSWVRVAIPGLPPADRLPRHTKRRSDLRHRRTRQHSPVSLSITALSGPRSRQCLRRGIGRHRDRGGAIADRGSIRGGCCGSVRTIDPGRAVQTRPMASRSFVQWRAPPGRHEPRLHGVTNWSCAKIRLRTRVCCQGGPEIHVRRCDSQPV